MIEWILIIALTGSGKAIAVIPDFLTAVECETAGQRWRQTNNQGLDIAVAVCVQRTK